MTDDLALILLLIVLLALALVLPHIILRRTIPKVINILRTHNATSEDRAVYAHEMGLAQKPLLERALKPKDNKPKALEALVQLNLVKYDDQGRVYLCEEALATTEWSQGQS